MKQILLVLTFLLGLTGNLFSQTKAIDLWNGKVPGSIEDPNYKQTVDSADQWVKMSFITTPELHMYEASADKSTGTAVIICPGGGYRHLAIGHEGVDIARWLNGIGVTAFVLHYRLPSDAIMADKSVGPLQDAQRAIRIVRSHAKEWNINPNRIGIMGFSAGGHLASTLSVHYDENVYQPVEPISARPDFSLLIYPVISMESGITHPGSRLNLLGENPSSEDINHFSNLLHADENTPPAFLVHSIDDEAVPVENSIGYAMALQKYGVPCELHMYQTGGHGYGLGRSKKTESSWPDACWRWMQASGFLNVK